MTARAARESSSARSPRVPAAAAALVAAAVLLTVAPSAGADATDDYPIPHRMVVTACTAEQILAAARDVEPVYYERYMADYRNHPPGVQQATRDKMHWFYGLTPEQRRGYSEELATNFADTLTVAWPNHAKVFFNNKGVAARTTDVCARYPRDDIAVWSGV